MTTTSQFITQAIETPNSSMTKRGLTRTLLSCFLAVVLAPIMNMQAQDVFVSVYDSGRVTNTGTSVVYTNRAHSIQTTNGYWGAWSHGYYGDPNWRVQIGTTPAATESTEALQVPFFSADGWSGELSAYPVGFHVFTNTALNGKNYAFQWAPGPGVGAPDMVRPAIHRGCVAAGTYNGAIRVWAVWIRRLESDCSSTLLLNQPPP